VIKPDPPTSGDGSDGEGNGSDSENGSNEGGSSEGNGNSGEDIEKQSEIADRAKHFRKNIRNVFHRTNVSRQTVRTRGEAEQPPQKPH